MRTKRCPSRGCPRATTRSRHDLCRSYEDLGVHEQGRRFLIFNFLNFRLFVFGSVYMRRLVAHWHFMCVRNEKWNGRHEFDMGI